MVSWILIVSMQSEPQQGLWNRLWPSANNPTQVLASCRVLADPFDGRYVSEWNSHLGSNHMDHVTRHKAVLHEMSLTPTPDNDSARVYHIEVEAIGE